MPCGGGSESLWAGWSFSPSGKQPLARLEGTKIIRRATLTSPMNTRKLTLANRLGCPPQPGRFVLYPVIPYRNVCFDNLDRSQTGYDTIVSILPQTRRPYQPPSHHPLLKRLFRCPASPSPRTTNFARLSPPRSRPTAMSRRRGNWQTYSNARR